MVESDVVQCPPARTKIHAYKMLNPLSPHQPAQSVGHNERINNIVVINIDFWFIEVEHCFYYFFSFRVCTRDSGIVSTAVGHRLQWIVAIDRIQCARVPSLRFKYRRGRFAIV